MHIAINTISAHNLQQDDATNTLFICQLIKKISQSINEHQYVFIVDEAHRSTFGDMLITIKNTFSSAIFFGFTGTPIQDENQKKLNSLRIISKSQVNRVLKNNK